MPRVTDNLRDAQALAEFSNLEPTRVEYFQNNYPDFVPRSWWDYESKEFEGKQWRLTQGYLRDVWQTQFKDRGAYYLIALLTSVFDPDHLFTTIAERAMDQVYPEGVPEGYTVTLPERKAFADFSEMGWGYIPLQRAVVYLFENSWRARFCAECNKRFVAAEPKNKFCSDQCSHDYRNRRKLKAWHAHKNEWRPARKKRDPRLPRFRKA